MTSPSPSSVFGALDPNPGALWASAGASQARTQGARRSIATRATEDAAWRSSAAVHKVQGRGERAPSGLIELSSGFCKSPRATVRLEGQNGKTHDTRPVVRSSCPETHKHTNIGARSERGEG
jgi:hypothetical protein